MASKLEDLRRSLVSSVDSLGAIPPRGSLKRAMGISLSVSLEDARVGDLCVLRLPSGEERLGEVVAIDGEEAVISPFSGMEGFSNLTLVVPKHEPMMVDVGRHLLGRVVNAYANDVAVPEGARIARVPVRNRPTPFTERAMIEERQSTGIAVIDTMLTVGRGQRIGVFGGAGLGKSTLVSMLANNSDADVVVVGLVGERGREVVEFWERHLHPDKKARTCVVAATSDRPAAERRLAAMTATAVAEGFRELGMNVLLIVDSLTRFARAQREIGLSSGEPPSRRGFPPSTAGVLAELVERPGAGHDASITAVYTVLLEGPIEEDPIAEELKSLLDGHVILSKKLSEAGQFPAIDILASRSRLQAHIVSPEHNKAAGRVRKLMSKFAEIELLVQVGEYAAGSDPVADEAIAKRERLAQLFMQDEHAMIDPDAHLAEVQELLADE
jgi:type III secretion protein N (ATPase)